MAIEGWDTHDEADRHRPEEQQQQHDARSLFGTEQLNAEEADRLLERDDARLVVWLGEHGAGKTTLCAELYERQRYGTDAVRFAGSWTLLALEQLAHVRRAAPASLPPTTSGLEADGREVLHLALSAGRSPLHLLLVDLAGEVFRRLADNQIAVEQIPWLARADKLVLLVDGERLLDPDARSSTLTRVRQHVERLRSAGLPKPGAKLGLLVTKWDLVRSDPIAMHYWEPREAELFAELRTIDMDAVVLRVGAALPSPHDGFGALSAWLLEVPPSPPPRQRPPADLWTEPVREPKPAPAPPAEPWTEPVREPRPVEAPPAEAWTEWVREQPATDLWTEPVSERPATDLWTEPVSVPKPAEAPPPSFEAPPMNVDAPRVKAEAPRPSFAWPEEPRRRLLPWRWRR